MTTIADYLNNSYKEDFDTYQADIFYLHIPRAIVKRAADEPSSIQVDYELDQNGNSVEKPQANTPQYTPVPENGAIDIPANWSSINGATQKLGTKALTQRLRQMYQEEMQGNPEEAFKGYTNKIFKGENTGVINWISQAADVVDWLNRVQFAANKGVPLYDVAGRGLLQGDATMPNILQNITQGTPMGTAEINDAVSQMYDIADRGKDGKSSWVSPGLIGRRMLAAGNRLGLADPNRIYEGDVGYSSSYAKDWNDAWADEYRKSVYDPEVKANDYKDNFYGWFDNPAWRGAARYATPWLAYGIPLSAIGSMMGNNSLWGPTILGALGAGAYGYGVGSGALKDFSENNPFGQMLDTIHSYANKPVGTIWNLLEPATGRVANRILTDKPDYTPPKPRPAAPEPKSTTAATYRPTWGPDNIYVQGQKPYTQAPDLLQIPDFSTPEQKFMETSNLA